MVEQIHGVDIDDVDIALISDGHYMPRMVFYLP